MNLIEKLNWRYAAKRYVSTKVSNDKLNRILEAIRLSASSAGIQPYSVLVVESDEVKKKLLAVGYNQPQITEASHLLVFAAWENLTIAKIDEYMQTIATVRGVSLESLEPFKARLSGFTARSAEDNFNWAARQAYIALGTGLVAAAFEEVDATPMEGFDAAGFDEVLNLKEKGLKSVVIMALGYRDAANDITVNFKKVRRENEKLFIHY